MIKNLFSIVLFSAFLPVCVLSVSAKGSPDKIVITSPSLAQPLEINDRETLKQFDPWSGQFIDWQRGPIAAPLDQTRCYDVLFYMKWPGRHSNFDRGDLKLIYSVRYCRGPNGEPGYIYLPSPDDDRYSVNPGTIWRERDDGKWHEASAAWEALMRRMMSAKQTRPAINNGMSSWRSARYLAIAFVILLIPGLYGSVIAIRRRTRKAIV